MSSSGPTNQTLSSEGGTTVNSDGSSQFEKTLTGMICKTVPDAIIDASTEASIAVFREFYEHRSNNTNERLQVPPPALLADLQKHMQRTLKGCVPASIDVASSAQSAASTRYSVDSKLKSHMEGGGRKAKVDAIWTFKVHDRGDGNAGSSNARSTPAAVSASTKTHQFVMTIDPGKPDPTWSLAHKELDA